MTPWAMADGPVDRKIDACDLLTDREVSQVIGLPVEPADRRDSGWIPQAPGQGRAYSSTCLWKVSADRDAGDPTKPLGGARFAILNAMSWPQGSAGGKTFLDSFRKAAKDHVIPHPPVPLAIGDEALWWGDGVAVRSGDTSFGISVHLANKDPRQRQMAETLARKIAGRIGATSVPVRLSPPL